MKLKKSGIQKFVLLIGFLICFGLLFSMVQNILRKKISGSADFIHYAYNLDKDTADVLFFGSSHVYYSVSPNELWGDYGIPAAVLGSPSQAFGNSYYLLKDLLKHQKPKAVVLEAYAASYDIPYVNETRMRQVLDAMPLSLTKLEAIQDLCKDFSFGKKMTYLFPISLYHSRWQELRMSDLIPKNAFLRGANLTLEYRDYSAYQSTKKKIKKAEFYDLTLYYLQKIVDLTKENDIPLILYSVPMASYRKGKYKTYYAANLAVEEYAKEQGIPFLFLENMDDLQFDYAKDFMDSEHVNYFGQKKITTFLAEYLKEHIDYQDRREDKKYRQYQKEYEKYQEVLAEKLAESPDGVYMGLPGEAVVEQED